MKHRLLAATAISLALPLGACSGGPEFNFASSAASQGETGDLDMSEYFERRLVDGKRNLIAGRLSKAATAFRQASRHADTAAAAANGLAITYDRLGRDDLAERYFRQAIAIDPANNRFQRNLARFEGKQMRVQLARKTPDSATALAAAPAPEPNAPERRQAALEITSANVRAEPVPSTRTVRTGGVRIETRPAGSAFVQVDDRSVRLTRVSRNEVRIGRTVTTPRPAARIETEIVKPATKTPDIVYISRPVIQRIAAASERADPASSFALDSATGASITGSGVTAIASLDLGTRTPLALGEAWNACKSGC